MFFACDFWFVCYLIFFPCPRCVCVCAFFSLFVICFVSCFLFLFDWSFGFHRRVGLMWFALLYIMHFSIELLLLDFFFFHLNKPNEFYVILSVWGATENATVRNSLLWSQTDDKK